MILPDLQDHTGSDHGILSTDPNFFLDRTHMLQRMTITPFPKGLQAGMLAMLISLALLLVAAGCTGPGSQDAQTPGEVTVKQPDSTHISITYNGGPESEKIRELEITVTDSKGSTRTQSIGSRLATTPITVLSTNTLTGSYEGKDHVVITGWYSDGTHKVVYDGTL